MFLEMMIQPIEKIKHLHKWNSKECIWIRRLSVKICQLIYKSSGILIKILIAMMKWK